ncbi:MAG: hypothetical protein JO076_08830 [Verrucomicrobia bacterium]|nr:hypothetical protein [Verrucomicrobiota bacterium]
MNSVLTEAAWSNPGTSDELESLESLKESLVLRAQLPVSLRAGRIIFGSLMEYREGAIMRRFEDHSIEIQSSPLGWLVSVRLKAAEPGEASRLSVIIPSDLDLRSGSPVGFQGILIKQLLPAFYGQPSGYSITTVPGWATSVGAAPEVVEYEFFSTLDFPAS